MPPGFEWPGGYRAAACFTFDLDAESPILFDHPEAAGWLDVMSHQAYGPRTAVPRLLRLLDRTGIRATFFIPGYSAERWPEAVRSVRDAGHEIAHHGYLHEAMRGKTEQQEADILDRGLEVLESVTGSRPIGYRAPMWELNWHSPKLLRDRGFLYDSSLMDTDHPYELAVADGGPLVEIPIQWALDDWEQYCYVPDFSGSGLIESPVKAIEMWRLE
ncbi:MAG TPA: polysaccharide deacetylase family protein, partial [Sporichthya sp.]|nr:polysaccharide deacetylase family protein [Sporichthya sp.]